MTDYTAALTHLQQQTAEVTNALITEWMQQTETLIAIAHTVSTCVTAPPGLRDLARIQHQHLQTALVTAQSIFTKTNTQKPKLIASRR